MKRYLIFISILILFFLSGGIFVPRDFGSSEKVIFRVEKGWGSEETALNLEKDKLLWWPTLFRAYVLISGNANKLQAGSYFLSPSMNIPQIVNKFVAGDIAKTKITIPEGFTSEQIHQKLQKLTKSDIVKLKENEGYLFPDTYEIAYGTPIEKIIQMMRENFNKKTADLKITPKVIIMASLLEKEVRTFEDKQLVSGIFWKRLRAGIPLESCATIAFIKGVDQWRYSFEDTRIESPYNTYLNLGLPPAPICNPGFESIKAALYPKDSEFWYYLSTPDGETVFSRTLDEHNIAKARYLE